MSTMAAIAAVCSLLLPLFQYWAANRPERKKEQLNEELKSGRNSIVDGNIAAVQQRIDSVLVEASNSSIAGEPSAEDVKRRIGQL